MWSKTFRELMLKFYGISIGMHSYGPCLAPGGLPPGTTVGNYCSFASAVQVLRRNHPIDRISQHPFFFNRILGLLDEDNIPGNSDNPLSIGHDVWIGLNAVITPGCKLIGNAAVVAAGAVVTTDVPSFAIVGGIPAKVIRFRFPRELQSQWLASKWWERPVTELAVALRGFLEPARPEFLRQFLEPRA